MNQLIPVTRHITGDYPTLVCNARDLHTFLETGTVFSDWIKRRIAEYQLVENTDYFLLLNNEKQNFDQRSPHGGHNSKDYQLALNAAKELAMGERTEKGHQIRRYFIECERRMHSQAARLPTGIIFRENNARHPYFAKAKMGGEDHTIGYYATIQEAHEARLRYIAYWRAAQRAHQPTAVAPAAPTATRPSVTPPVPSTIPPSVTPAVTVPLLNTEGRWLVTVRPDGSGEVENADGYQLIKADTLRQLQNELAKIFGTKALSSGVPTL